MSSEVRSEVFSCTLCFKQFRHLRNVKEHEKICQSKESKSKYASGVICPDCKQVFGRLDSLRIHVEETHEIPQEVENLHFESKNEFEKWKKKTEKENICSYSMKRSTNPTAGVKRNYLYCHRTGFFQSRSKGDRRIKSQGSNKLDATCTSAMVVVELPGDKIEVVFHKTHFGHGTNLGRCRLTQEERTFIAGKIAEGVTFEHILDGIRDNVENVYDVRTLLTKRDILNIQRDFNLFNGRQHNSDYISVKLWIEKMNSLPEDENPIIFHELTDDDVFLIIANQFQKEMLCKFGDQKICIDSTHGLNEYEINLTSIVVVDEFGNGFPAVFCFSSKKDTQTWCTLFEKVKNIISGPITTNVFMSDDDPAFYNAWAQVMGPAHKKLLCSWHVDQSWRRNIQSKIKSSLEVKTLVYKTIKILHHETNEENFQAMAKSFVQELNNDDNTNEFGTYFSTYYMNRVEEWAYCYRKNCGINTNMFLESIHKSIKYFYLNGRKNKRMDSCINALMKFIRDRMFAQFIKVAKNKYTAKSDNIHRSHQLGIAITDGITCVSESSWLVSSCAVKNITYEVSETGKLCDFENCQLRCRICDICVHQYACNCPDHVIKGNICKHIHACVNQKKSPVLNSPSEDVNIDVAPFEKALVTTKKDQSVKNDLLRKMDLGKGMLLTNEYTTEEFDNIVKVVDKCLDLLAKKKRKIKETDNNEPSNKKVEKQLQFKTKKKKSQKSSIEASTSVNEVAVIKNAFNAESKEKGVNVLDLNFGTDHSYLV